MKLVYCALCNGSCAVGGGDSPDDGCYCNAGWVTADGLPCKLDGKVIAPPEDSTRPKGYVNWKSIPNSPDYISDDGSFRAVYAGTKKGQASYKVFFADTPKSRRTMKNALCVGGLPETLM